MVTALIISEMMEPRMPLLLRRPVMDEKTERLALDVSDVIMKGTVKETFLKLNNNTFIILFFLVFKC